MLDHTADESTLERFVDGCDGQLAYTTDESPGSTITVRLPAVEPDAPR